MLFDVEADPKEMSNLIHSHTDTEILAILRAKCAAHSHSLNQERQVYKKTLPIKKR